MTTTIGKLPGIGGQSALDRLKSPPTNDLKLEKQRLHKVTREFESFFLYQMLKTMRQTVPENSLTKDSPLASGMGRETYTDMFDMEIARNVGVGGNQSISEMLYGSMVKLVEARFGEQAQEGGELKPLRPEEPAIKLDKASPVPLPQKIDEFKPIPKSDQMMPIGGLHLNIKEDPILARFGEHILEAAQEHNLDSALITSIIRAESSGNPDAVSPAGAKGLMQLTDTTAKHLNVANVFDPQENIEAGSRYLREMLDRFGDVKLALAAYNAGPGNVVKYGGVPPFPETQRYLERVTAHLSEVRQNLSPPKP